MQACMPASSAFQIRYQKVLVPLLMFLVEMSA
jgi:hypothetical protein